MECMRKPNWKRRGLGQPVTPEALRGLRAKMKRDAMLAKLPPDIRRIIEEQPQLERFL